MLHFWLHRPLQNRYCLATGWPFTCRRRNPPPSSSPPFLLSSGQKLTPNTLISWLRLRSWQVELSPRWCLTEPIDVTSALRDVTSCLRGPVTMQRRASDNITQRQSLGYWSDISQLETLKSIWHVEVWYLLRVLRVHLLLDLERFALNDMNLTG